MRKPPDSHLLITQELAKIVGRLHQLKWEVAEQPGITRDHTDRIVFLKELAEDDLNFFVKERANANQNM